MRFEDFRADYVLVNGISVFYKAAGEGEPLLLLHGFPETHLMWSKIAPELASHYRVICPDLPGYGRSTSNSGDKSTMAEDLVAFMNALGFENFAVVGHDRGARVAYRMALEHPDVVSRLAVFDIVPTHFAFDRANADFTLGFWPWSLLAQPAPLPERLLEEAAEDVIENAITEWGTDASVFTPALRREYAFALRGSAESICEEFRAAASVDREADRKDFTRGRKIVCPTLVLWASDGAVDKWYREEGGPLALWRKFCISVSGHAIDGGHFFPEGNPDGTLSELAHFLGAREPASAENSGSWRRQPITPPKSATLRQIDR